MTESSGPEEAVTTAKRKLYLEFHGRVIEHLGIQMYQSPVNAIAELVANAWDADATSAEIELPDTVTPGTPLPCRYDLRCERQWHLPSLQTRRENNRRITRATYMLGG